MFSKSRNLIIVAIVAALAITFAACDGGGNSSVPNLANERAQTCTTAVMDQSSELWNICTRYNRLSDPNHVSYMYLLGNTGDIIAEYQVIGKCTSTDSTVTNPETASRDGSYTGGAAVTLPNRQLDGSYGQNELAIYCFIDNASKTMVEFSTQFIWSDSPLPLNSPPQIVIVPNGK